MMRIDGRYGPPAPKNLTKMQEKEVLYATDSYFWEGWDDLVDVAGPQAASIAERHSLVLIRPDAIVSRKVETILVWLVENDFRVVSCLPVTFDRHRVRSLWWYQWNCALRERKDACDILMSATDSLLVTIRSLNDSEWAARRFARLKGSSNPALAQAGGLRTQLGHKSRMLSFIHSPDEPADFVRELAVMLGAGPRRRLMQEMRDELSSSTPDKCRDATARVYEGLPEHTLDLREALIRVAEQVEQGLAAEGSDLAAARKMIDEVLAGRHVDWRDLFRLLDEDGVVYDEWDRITIAGHIIHMDDGKRGPLIPNAPRSDEDAERQGSPREEGVLIGAENGPPIPVGLTSLCEKAALFATDTYFWEGWEDVLEVAGDSAQAMLHAHALLMLKPDAVAARKLNTVIPWLPRNRFSIVGCVTHRVMPAETKALWRYQWNTAPRERREAYDLMFAAGPSLVLMLRFLEGQDESASERITRLKGPADPALQEPNDLRSVLGSGAHLLSFVHATDEPADVARELAILLGPSERRSLLSRMMKGEVCAEKVLIDACRALDREVAEAALDFDASLKRLGEAAAACMDENDPDLALATRLLSRLRRGEGDWRGLFSLLEKHDASFDPWDLITVAGHVADVSYPGIQVLVPGVGPRRSGR